MARELAVEFGEHKVMPLAGRNSVPAEASAEFFAWVAPLTMKLALGSVWNTAASVGSLTQAPTTRENPCSATNNYAQKSRWQNVVPMVDFVRLIWRNETTCLFQSPTYPGTFST
jgi:hypothetical protein